MKVPKKKRPKQPPTVCPAGRHAATLKAQRGEDETTWLDWDVAVAESDGFRDLSFSVPQLLRDKRELNDLLVDLGFGGQDVKWEDVLGVKAMVTVATYGGRQTARVIHASAAFSPESLL